MRTKIGDFRSAMTFIIGKPISIVTKIIGRRSTVLVKKPNGLIKSDVWSGNLTFKLYHPNSSPATVARKRCLDELADARARILQLL